MPSSASSSGPRGAASVGPLVGRVRLNAEHLVREDGARYLVESRERSDPARNYAQPVSKQGVEAVASILARRDQASIDTVLGGVESRGPARLGFLCYGWQ